jgi:hypothetical protein
MRAIFTSNLSGCGGNISNVSRGKNGAQANSSPAARPIMTLLKRPHHLKMQNIQTNAAKTNTKRDLASDIITCNSPCKLAYNSQLDNLHVCQKGVANCSSATDDCRRQSSTANKIWTPEVSPSSTGIPSVHECPVASVRLLALATEDQSVGQSVCLSPKLQ